MAVDKWYLARQKDEDGAFFVKASGDMGPVQGLYVTDAIGTPLARDYFRPDPERFLQLLQAGKTKFIPPTATIADAPGDARFDRTPPRSGWIVDVYTRIGKQESGPWTPNRAIGRDRFWLSASEKSALIGGTIPASVQTRLIRFHLLDNIRGEPDFWRPDEIRQESLTLKDGRLSGTVRLATKNGRRGYDTRVQGTISATTFDLVCWGEAWGRSTYTPGEPPGRFPLVVGFSLAPVSDPLRSLPPQALKTGEYRLPQSSQ